MSNGSKSSFSLRVCLRSIAVSGWKARMLFTLAAFTLIGGTMLAGCSGGDSASNAPGGNGANPGAGSGVVNATFSNASGTNAGTGAFQSTTAQALTNSNTSGLTLLNITASSLSGTTSRSFTISLAENGPIQAGKTYVFSDTSASTLTFTQAGLSGAQVWLANGGSAIVDSITGKNYKIRLVNVTLTAGADNASGATGSFTVNGTADATLP